MNSDGRSRRRELVEEAYNLQVKAGLTGAAQYGAFGLGSTIFAHRAWPTFRRQTLAFKGFLVSIITIYGLVSCADTALLSHENQQRRAENDLRREARIDLARRGLVATESQIMKWREEHNDEGSR
ncbi:hypothetical protein F5148DRAFT_578092 [Russula earlei]|uniref:Uncharacterized protein n=1 Tax=Russula earlei TaxID=71964 RepID=A0ACC0UF99_9AGAM|nr:hypothetical protein F5148DRAFT_578092 [Russula earlei]